MTDPTIPEWLRAVPRYPSALSEEREWWRVADVVAAAQAIQRALIQAIEERDAANEEIERLCDWRATVTAAVQHEGGALYDDVPRLIRELTAEREAMQRRAEAAERLFEAVVHTYEGDDQMVQADLKDASFVKRARAHRKASERERDALRGALIELEGLYKTDRIASEQARQIERIFDEQLHTALEGRRGLSDTPNQPETEAAELSDLEPPSTRPPQPDGEQTPRERAEWLAREIHRGAVAASAAIADAIELEILRLVGRDLGRAREAIAAAMGRDRGTEPIVDAVARLARDYEAGQTPPDLTALRAVVAKWREELQRIGRINTEEARQRVVAELTMFMALNEIEEALKALPDQPDLTALRAVFAAYDADVDGTRVNDADVIAVARQLVEKEQS